jgi:Rho-binding antiterminator
MVVMDKYTLVNCDFYDRLEAWATLRQICQIIYRNTNSEKIQVQSRIVDVYAAKGADFLKLEDGVEIRLDKIISVNGEKISYSLD